MEPAPYKAFISYSHEGDARLAEALQVELQRYAKPWRKLRSIRVFRDKTGLTANPALWQAIETALNSAEFLLLLASPKAALSHWVGKELEHWLAIRPASHILIVLTDGEIAWNHAAADFDWQQTTALSRGLAGRFTEEPLWVDLRRIRGESDFSVATPAFRDAIADLSSALRGIPKDELIGQDVDQHRKLSIFRRSVFAGLATLTLCLGIAALIAFRNQQLAVRNAEQAKQNERRAVENEKLARLNEAEAKTQAQRSLARQLAAESENLRQQRAELQRSALLAVEAANRYPDSAEASQALEGALALLPRRVSEISMGIPVDRAAFDSAGRWLLVTHLREAQVWDLKSHTRTARIVVPSDNISAARLSPDGAKFALAHHCVVAVYETAGGRRLGEKDLGADAKRFTPGCISITALDISPDGNQIAGSGDSTATLVWDLRTGIARDLYHSRAAAASSVNSLAFSPAGDRLVSVRTGDVSLWNTTTWAQSNPDRAQPWSSSEMAAFDPDRGVVLAVVSGYGLAVWYLPRLERVKGMSLSGNNFTSSVALAFNRPAMKGLNQIFAASMAAASAGNEAVVWNLDDGRLDSGRELGRVRHQGPIVSMAFGADAATLLTVSEDKTAGFWQIEGGRERIRMVHNAPLRAGSFTAGGSVWTVDSGGIAREWDLRRKPAPTPDAMSLARWSDGRRDLTARYTGAGLEVRDQRAGRRVLFLANRDIDSIVDSKSYTHGIDAVQFLADGRYLTVRGPSYNQMWDLSSGRKIPLVPDGSPLRELVFTPDFRLAAGRQLNNEIRVVRVPSGELVRLIPTRETGVKLDLALSPDGRYLAKTGPLVTVWDLSNSASSRPAFQTSDYGLSLEAFTSDSAYAIGRNRMSTLVFVKLLPPADAFPLPLEGYPYLAPSPRGSLVAIGEGDRIRIWDPAARQNVVMLDLPGVKRLLFRADGSQFAAIATDGLLGVWETASWRQVARFALETPDESFDFGPEGRLIVGGRTDPVREICGLLLHNFTPVEWKQHLPGEDYRKTCANLP